MKGGRVKEGGEESTDHCVPAERGKRAKKMTSAHVCVVRYQLTFKKNVY